jgi:DNA-binding MarR family transcriptional regulator
MNIPSYLSGAVFMQAYRILRMQVVNCLNEFDLTPTSWVLLGLLEQSPDGMRLSHIAKRLNVKAPLVTNMAHRLLEEGLINRIPHHTDKRAKLLVLTSKGKQFMAQVEKQMEGTLSALLNGVSEQDLVSYKKVLDAIILNSNL